MRSGTCRRGEKARRARNLLSIHSRAVYDVAQTFTRGVISESLWDEPRRCGEEARSEWLARESSHPGDRAAFDRRRQVRRADQE